LYLSGSNVSLARKQHVPNQHSGGSVLSDNLVAPLDVPALVARATLVNDSLARAVSKQNSARTAVGAS
jgi:hypothetical protein